VGLRNLLEKKWGKDGEKVPICPSNGKEMKSYHLNGLNGKGEKGLQKPRGGKGNIRRDRGFPEKNDNGYYS